MPYCNFKQFPDAIRSVGDQSYASENLTLIIVPNNSPDGIAEEVRQRILPRSGVDLPEVVLLDDGVNRGFSGGNNLGIRWAMERGFEYVFLQNGDLKLDPRTIEACVGLAEADPPIGAVQALVLHWSDPERINIAGCAFQIAGYGYARYNGRPRSTVPLADGQEITYASGAAVLYRVAALAKVGLLEEGFFMYHEDLELGLRLRMAGYRNVLSIRAPAYHDYSFHRNALKLQWMELYRWVVLLAYYKVLTLVLLAPLLLAMEAGTWLMALRGGWLKAKIWACLRMFDPGTWRLVRRIRRHVQSVRSLSDREFLRVVSGSMELPQEDRLVHEILNPAMESAVRWVSRLVRW